MFGADDRPQRGPLDAAAVADEDDVGREDVEQTLQVPGLQRVSERLQGRPGLVGGHHLPRAAGIDVLAGAVRDLPDGGRGLVDGGRDLVVADVEGLAQHEHGPLGRRQRLEHEHHRHRHGLGQLDVLGHVRRGEQRLGQPGTDVGLLATPQGAQPVERLSGRDPDQVGALVTHLPQVDLHPPQPGLLQDVFRVGG